MKLSIERYDTSEILGLPEDGQCFTLSNSERSTATCSLRWRYRYGYLLGGVKGAAMRYGTAWHECLNDFGRAWLDGQVLSRGDERQRFTDNFDSTCPRCTHYTTTTKVGEICDRCKGTGLGVLPRVHMTLKQEARAAGEDAFTSLEEIDETVETLRRALWGYVKRWGWEPPGGVKVIAVEQQVAAPILNPSTGQPYRPLSYLEELPDGSLIPAGPKSPADRVRKVDWPYYYIGTLDLLGVTKSGRLWFTEHKSSADPEGYIRGLSVDPQTGGYEMLAHVAAKAGHFGLRAAHFDDPVAGLTYDVASSQRQQDPKRNKPKIRQRKDETPEDFAARLAEQPIDFSKSVTFIPTWRWSRALETLGLSEVDYADRLDAARSVDHACYVREHVPASAARRARFAHEIYSVAREIARMQREHYRARTLLAEAKAFPRTPVCMRPGAGCSYRSVCVHDSPEAREVLGTRKGPIWRPDDYLQTTITENS